MSLVLTGGSIEICCKRLDSVILFHNFALLLSQDILDVKTLHEED